VWLRFPLPLDSGHWSLNMCDTIWCRFPFEGGTSTFHKLPLEAVFFSSAFPRAVLEQDPPLPLSLHRSSGYPRLPSTPEYSLLSSVLSYPHPNAPSEDPIRCNCWQYSLLPPPFFCLLAAPFFSLSPFSRSPHFLPAKSTEAVRFAG